MKKLLKVLFPAKYRTPEEQAEYDKRQEEVQKQTDKQVYEARYGVLNDKIKCNYCENVGSVRFRRVQTKKGFSTGKATAAVLTAGISVIATGLAKKGGASKLYCENCKMEWEE